MKYVLFGATDRVNYGDNLFAVLLNQVIKDVCGPDGEIKNYGVLESDLSWYGALPTLPVRELYEDPFTENARIIIVGGEVLNGNWAGIYQYCNTTFRRLYRNRIGKRLIKQEWVRGYLGGKGEFPFIPTPDMFDHNVEIAFNAVGGSRTVAFAKKTAPLLAHAKYKSFRDDQTFTTLKEVGMADGELTPDSAILMSNVFTPQQIRKGVSEQCAKFADNNEFLFFQIGYFKGGKDSDSVAQQLVEILQETAYHICLCPIGLAAGHDDHIALEAIHRKIIELGHSDRVVFFTRPNMWETMFLIKESECYLGTSLHGIITAQSFVVPYLLINNKVKKGMDYMSSWGVGSSEETSATLTGFSSAFLVLSLPDLQNKISKATSEQLAMAKENIARVINVDTEIINGRYGA